MPLVGVEAEGEEESGVGVSKTEKTEFCRGFISRFIWPEFIFFSFPCHLLPKRKYVNKSSLSNQTFIKADVCQNIRISIAVLFVQLNKKQTNVHQLLNRLVGCVTLIQ